MTAETFSWLTCRSICRPFLHHSCSAGCADRALCRQLGGSMPLQCLHLLHAQLPTTGRKWLLLGQHRDASGTSGLLLLPWWCPSACMHTTGLWKSAGLAHRGEGRATGAWKSRKCLQHGRLLESWSLALRFWGSAVALCSIQVSGSLFQLVFSPVWHELQLPVRFSSAWVDQDQAWGRSSGWYVQCTEHCLPLHVLHPVVPAGVVVLTVGRAYSTSWATVV